MSQQRVSTCRQQPNGPDDAHGGTKGLAKIGAGILQADVDPLGAIEAARKDGHDADVYQQSTEQRKGRLDAVVCQRLLLARVLPRVNLPARCKLKFSYYVKRTNTWHLQNIAKC